jgi:hypothetical protein
MFVVSGLAAICYLIVGTTVGVRMLALSRRTGELPERLLGAGLSSVTFVTLPLVALALVVKPGGPELQQILYAFSFVPVVAFAMSIFAFTALVFRHSTRVATLSVALAGLLTTIGVAGIVLSRVAVWGADRVVGAHWTQLVVGVFVAGFLWTGIESIAYYGPMRRRLRLGLADPVVCDRIRLWAIGSLVAAVSLCGLAFSMQMGWRAVNHPVPILSISAAGFSVSITWYLAFLPPAFYLRRSAGASGGEGHSAA